MGCSEARSVGLTTRSSGFKEDDQGQSHEFGNHQHLEAGAFKGVGGVAAIRPLAMLVEIFP